MAESAESVVVVAIMVYGASKRRKPGSRVEPDTPCMPPSSGSGVVARGGGIGRPTVFHPLLWDFGETREVVAVKGSQLHLRVLRVGAVADAA